MSHMKTLQEQYRQKQLRKFLILEMKISDMLEATKQLMKTIDANGLSDFLSSTASGALKPFEQWFTDYSEWVLENDNTYNTLLQISIDGANHKTKYSDDQIKELQAGLEQLINTTDQFGNIKAEITNIVKNIKDTISKISNGLQSKPGLLSKIKNVAAAQNDKAVNGTEHKQYDKLLNTGNKTADSIIKFILKDVDVSDPKQLQTQLEQYGQKLETYATSLNQIDSFVDQLDGAISKIKEFLEPKDAAQNPNEAKPETGQKPENAKGTDAEQKKERSHDENISTAPINAEIMPPFASILTDMGATDLKNKDPKVLKAFRDFYDKVDTAITKAIADKKIAVQKKA